jgi:hypothetical protein
LLGLETSSYLEQKKRWPVEGRHILAQYDARSIIVYQAYRPSIGRFAVDHGYFGGEFSFQRMSWIKTNFLWMMYRSAWGTKPNQEITLAVRIQRPFFDAVLAQAVPSAFDADLYPDVASWRRDLRASRVRLQWDPDHDLIGARVRRRAIQLGLRGQVLNEYARDAILEIMDISEFVAEQRMHARAGDHTKLVTPTERVYRLPDEGLVARLKLSWFTD